MLIDKLLNQSNAPMLEQVLAFTAARHKLIAENIVNVDTPNYRQKDLSPARFQRLLQDRVDERRTNGSLGFDDIQVQLEHPQRSILFHDGNNRSMEQLMTDQAKNALLHNMVIELLRKQFQGMEMALRDRFS